MKTEDSINFHAKNLKGADIADIMQAPDKRDRGKTT